MIADLLDQLRQPAGHRRTLTIDARWLMMSSDDLDAFAWAKDSNGVAVDRKNPRGISRARSGRHPWTDETASAVRLVYLTSGTNRNGCIGLDSCRRGAMGHWQRRRLRWLLLTASRKFDLLPSRRSSTVGRQSSRGLSSRLLEVRTWGAFVGKFRPTMIGNTNLAGRGAPIDVDCPPARTRGRAPSGKRRAKTDRPRGRPSDPSRGRNTPARYKTMRMELGKANGRPAA